MHRSQVCNANRWCNERAGADILRRPSLSAFCAATRLSGETPGGPSPGRGTAVNRCGFCPWPEPMARTRKSRLRPLAAGHLARSVGSIAQCGPPPFSRTTMKPQSRPLGDAIGQNAGWGSVRPMGASEESGAVESEIVFRLPVEAGKIREFALAVAEDNPVHYDADEARRQG